MRYVLLIVAAGTQKASKTKILLTHMVYFPVAVSCKSLPFRQPFSGVQITIYFCLCACNCCTSCRDTYQHSSWLHSVYVSVNGRDSVRVWGGWEAKQREDWLYVWVCVSVWVCGCDKILKPGAHHSFIFGRRSASLERENSSSSSSSSSSTANRSANLSVSLTPGNRSFPLFIRSDLYFL